MKTISIKSILAFFALSVIMISCGKYEDGPAFSLRSKKSRLCGEWVVESYTYDNQDMTADFVALVGANYVLEIEKDGTYRTESDTPDKGTWELGEDGDDVRFTSSDSGAVEVNYRILRLASKELWLKHTYSDGKIDVTKYKAK